MGAVKTTFVRLKKERSGFSDSTALSVLLVVQYLLMLYFFSLSFFPVKRNLDLEDFTFSQTNLEQMFLDLAREQKEGDSKYSVATDSDVSTSSPQSSTESASSENHTTDTRVDSPDIDPHLSTPVRGAEDEGGASCQGALSDADAAVGMVIVHHSGDDNGGGVAGVQEGGATDAGAAAPVVFNLDGVDNPAYVHDEEDRHEPQTSV